MPLSRPSGTQSFSIPTRQFPAGPSASGQAPRSDIIATGVISRLRMMTVPNEIVARRLVKQAEWCERLDSRLYSTLLREAAEDVRAAGVCSAVLEDHHDDPHDSALALRFLGAV